MPSVRLLVIVALHRRYGGPRDLHAVGVGPVAVPYDDPFGGEEADTVAETVIERQLAARLPAPGDLLGVDLQPDANLGACGHLLGPDVAARGVLVVQRAFAVALAEGGVAVLEDRLPLGLRGLEQFAEDFAVRDVPARHMHDAPVVVGVTRAAAQIIAVVANETHRPGVVVLPFAGAELAAVVRDRGRRGAVRVGQGAFVEVHVQRVGEPAVALDAGVRPAVRVLPVAACLRRGYLDVEAGAVRGAVQMQLAVSGPVLLFVGSTLEVCPRGERAQVERAGPVDRAVAESLGRPGRLRAYRVCVDVQRALQRLGVLVPLKVVSAVGVHAGLGVGHRDDRDGLQLDA